LDTSDGAAPPTVVYDACVLYPAPLRSFLMYLTLVGACRARWSRQIHDEWMRNVSANHPDIPWTKIERVRDLMDAHVLDALVVGHERLIDSLELPDADDRHVLAAAIHSRARLVLTFNLKHFPVTRLQPFGIRAVDPDEFGVELLSTSRPLVVEAARRQRASLKNPPMDVDRFLATLAKQRLPRTALELEADRENI